MQEYKRSLNCECSQYKDIDTISLSERYNLKDYWMRGFIYSNSSSKECDCHKRYRLTGRYNRLAEKCGLLSYEILKSYKYIGNSNVYEKLRVLPNIIEEKKLKNVLVFINGPENCQKTTSVSKIIYNLITEDKSVSYIDFVDLTNKFVNKDEDLTKTLDTDWLVIDNCFEGETVNFKTVYNSFYNLLLKRQQPIILISSLKKEDLFNSKGQQLPSYNEDMLKKVFNKIERFNTNLVFEENIDKLLTIGNGKQIDIWAL